MKQEQRSSPFSASHNLRPVDISRVAASSKSPWHSWHSWHSRKAIPGLRISPVTWPSSYSPRRLTNSLPWTIFFLTAMGTFSHHVNEQPMPSLGSYKTWAFPPSRPDSLVNQPDKTRRTFFLGRYHGYKRTRTSQQTGTVQPPPARDSRGRTTAREGLHTPFVALGDY